MKDNEDNTDTFTSRVEVNQGNNAPIARVAQTRMTKIELQELPLDASPSYDDNVDCGDQIVSFEWDVDGDGVFGGERDITTDQPRVVLSWAEAAERLGWNGEDLALVRLITVRVTDTFGAQTTAQMELTVYKADPVPRFEQRPSPAPIDEETGLVEVLLDARESYSPIPGGQIINYEWDFDCADGSPQFTEAVGEPVITFRRIFEVVDPTSVPRPIVCLQVTDHRGSKVSIQKAIENKMRFRMDFGGLLEGFWNDFGPKLGAKLGPSWHQTRTKWGTKTMSKSHRKSGAATGTQVAAGSRSAGPK